MTSKRKKKNRSRQNSGKQHVAVSGSIPAEQPTSSSSQPDEGKHNDAVSGSTTEEQPTSSFSQPDEGKQHLAVSGSIPAEQPTSSSSQPDEGKRNDAVSDSTMEEQPTSRFSQPDEDDNSAQWPILSQNDVVSEGKKVISTKAFGTNIVHNINSIYTQIGDANVILNKEQESSIESSHVCNTEPSQKSFAKAVDPITTKQLNINYHFDNRSEPKQRTSSDIKKESEMKKFSEDLGNLSRGNFILIAGKLKRVSNLGSLGQISWTAVLDFDTESRSNGLLSYTEATLEKKTSVHINTWQDKLQFTDANCCWIFMRGSIDRPDTVIEKDFRLWKKTTHTCIKNIVLGLENFKAGCSECSIIVLWPEDEEIQRFLNYTLSKLEDINPHIMIVTGGNDTSKLSSDFLEDFDSVELGIKDICNVISGKFSKIESVGAECYRIPTSDKSNDPGIDEKEFHMLKEELEIIFFENHTGVKYNFTDLLNEEENFFRGGTLPWAWWYHANAGQADVERDITSNIIKYIKQEHIDICKSGRVTLYHFPGSGGTTLAQRVLWDLRNEIPCAQVLHRSEQALSGLSEKVQFLSDKTHLPILLLMDGEEEQKVDHLQRILNCCTIIFYVKRCLTKPPLLAGEFWLQQFVSKREGQIIGMKYINQCAKLNKTEKQIKVVRRIIEEIEKGSNHTIFEIGLAVHSFKYQGIYSYVKGFLRLEDNDKKVLLARQNILIFLSLAHYYGQTSVPCQFMSDLVEKKSAKQTLQYQDIPDDIKELIVCDQHERRKNMIRINHFYVAKEILDQVLLWIQNESESSKNTLIPHISFKAKKALAPFVEEFIMNAGKITKNVAYDTVLKVLIRTIILRDNTAVGEDETQATRTKRSKLSPILEDVSSGPPFKERFDVMTKLTEAFPQEPQFFAHLGRLYTICRPEQVQKAETCFKKALEICENITKHVPSEAIPLNRKLDLMHVFHMYGNMLSSRVAQYTGKYLGDVPRQQVDKDGICNATNIVLEFTKNACDCFVKCREFTPPGCEKSVGFIGEINVRLMFCAFIIRYVCKGKKWDIHKFIDSDKTEIGKFVFECFIKLDELFVDCFSSIEPDHIDESVWSCQIWFHQLFKTRPGYVINRNTRGLDNSRKKIAMLKMKYSSNNQLGILENISNREDIQTIVEEYEKILEEIDIEQTKLRPSISRRNVDIDFKEWLFAIRHFLFPKHYRVEDIFVKVQKWFDMVQTQDARFYLFILHTLIGFGDEENNGDQRLLIESQKIKNELIKYSKYMAKPKYPREWLGVAKSGLGIKRLTPGKRFFGAANETHNNFSTTDLDLEVMKGTICPPNDKPAVGYIALDLGPANKISVNVFYVPARCDLRGEMNKGTRVEFVIGFSMFHGYEAFNVKKIGRLICNECKKLVEFRSCDKIVCCSGCTTKLKVNNNGKHRAEP